MPISVVRTYNFSRSTASPWTNNVNTTGGNLLVSALVGYTWNDVANVKFNNIALTRASFNTQATRSVSLWYLLDPPQGTFSHYHESVNGQFSSLVCAIYSGVDTAIGLDAVTTNFTSGSTDWQPTMTTVNDKCITMMSFYCNNFSGAVCSAGTDTIYRQVGFTTGNGLFEGATRVTPAGVDTFNVLVTPSNREMSGVFCSFAPQAPPARRKIITT